MFELYRDLVVFSLVEDIEKKEKVDLMFSAGMDSLVLFLALKELKKEFVCQTFYLEGKEKTDYEKARIACDFYNVPLVPTVIPKLTKNEIVDNLKKLIFKIKSYRKRDVEVIYPYLYVADNLQTQDVVIGFDYAGGDTRVERQHYMKDTTPDRYKEFCEKGWLNENSSGKQVLSEFLKIHSNKNLHVPYKKRYMIEYINQFTLKELHSPKQKQYKYEGFKTEIDRVGLYRLNIPSQQDTKDYFKEVFGFKNPMEARSFYQKIYKEVHQNT